MLTFWVGRQAVDRQGVGAWVGLRGEGWKQKEGCDGGGGQRSGGRWEVCSQGQPVRGGRGQSQRPCGRDLSWVTGHLPRSRCRNRGQRSHPGHPLQPHPHIQILGGTRGSDPGVPWRAGALKTVWKGSEGLRRLTQGDLSSWEYQEVLLAGGA